MTALLTLVLAFGGAQRVAIQNAAGLHMVLYRVVEDGSAEVEILGSDREIVRELPFGAYWIRAEGCDGPVAVPVPVHRRALRPKTIVVPVLPPREAVSGFVWIPGGPTLVGDTLGVGQEDERPACVVDVPGFYLGRHEVTEQQFAHFLNGQPAVDARWLHAESRKIALRRDPSGSWASHDPRRPMVTVSWLGACAYCRWLTEATGVEHRLPSEIEWERAARGPESFVYAYGNTYTRNRANQESGTLMPVEEFLPNGFGVHDLTGNAFEWVADAYDAPGAPRGSEGGERPFRVLRGGSFVLDGMYSRNSFRMRHRESVQADDFGFRVVRESEDRR